MGTSMAREYELAGTIIRRFVDGDVNLEIDGAQVAYADLPTDARSRFSVAMLKQWQAEYHASVVASDAGDTMKRDQGTQQ
jgi:hypothetical protein